MDKKRSKGQATRAHIVAAATDLFSTLGYEATSIEAVLARAAISRGALYHHFDSKQALFIAVFETLEAKIAQATIDASRGIADRIVALRVGAEAFLELSRDPAVRQIVLIDAPAALGWDTWRAIDARYGFGLLRNSLKAASAAGRPRRDLVDTFAHVLLAAILELALLIARADDPALASRRARAALKELIDGLLDPSSPGRRGSPRAPTNPRDSNRRR